ncbi:decapping and exoribonuclease protein-like isoform X2 [Mya arenaria]|uniref:decapping and exoribonuclease protein-like isoform X2 n=1 Tax=Mya arenaria TaxID=6604 RepID=UPI0022E87454|nr:decapping and exoribonuclease protein-like isoform X2 [Mya arenaria]
MAAAAKDRDPTKIGCFSLDIDGNFHDDDSKKKTFNKPPNYTPDVSVTVKFDLNKGRMAERRDEQKHEKLDNLLDWISGHKQEIIKDGNTQTDFVCRRSLLKEVMSFPFEENKKLRLDVTLHKGIFYLNKGKYPTENLEQQDTQQQPQMGRIEGDWGYKFEQYLTEESTNSVPDMVYNSRESFYNVMKVKLGSHTIVYSSRVDAVSADESGEHSVEFKTVKESKPGTKPFNKYKLRDMWIQSVLGGVPEIICGLRSVEGKTDTGIVIKLKTYKTEKIPTMKDIPGLWKPDKCWKSLDKLLTFIKSNVKENNPSLGLEMQGDDYTIRPPHEFLPETYTTDQPGL